MLRGRLHLTLLDQQHPPKSLTKLTQIMAPVSFWGGPITYFQWAARHKPAIFWSFVVGSLGPVAVVSIDLKGVHNHSED